MNDLLKVRELIVEAILESKVNAKETDRVFFKQVGYSNGLLKAKNIIDEYIEIELENMASEAAGK